MPSHATSPAGPASEFAPNDYDGFAEAYTAENETYLLNAHYAQPALLDLAGEVAGRQILDAGCGAGSVFASLRDRDQPRRRLGNAERRPEQTRP